MPPKRSAPFLLPDAPLKKKPKGPGTNKVRDVGAEFEKKYGADRARLQAALDALDKVHLRPLSMTTLIKIDRCRRYYLGFLTWYFQDEAKARETLENGAQPIPMPVLKLLIQDTAINGRSGFAGNTGWSLTTARSFVHTLDSMRKRHLTVPFTPDQVRELLNFVEDLAKVQKSISTTKRVKRFVREVDLLEIFAAFLSPNFQPQENYTRIQMTALCGFIFVHGIRIGSVIQNSAYTGLGQFLTWGDTEWIVTGWQEGTGISIQIFFKIKWMKNMRLDESSYIQVTSRSLPRKHLIFCHIPFLLAMAIFNDVFEEDLSALGSDRARVEALTAKNPFHLTMKPTAMGRPVFSQRYSLAKKRIVAEDGSISHEPLSTPSSKLTPREQVKESKAKKAAEYNTHPMTVSSADHFLKDIALLTNHQDATFASMRIGFSRRMLGRIPSEHFKYLFGHSPRTEIAGTVYQTPDRPVDISSVLYGIDENNKYSDLHSSVSWNTKDASILPTIDETLTNPQMRQALSHVKLLEAKVIKKFGCSSKEIPDENLTDDDVTKAIEAWADLIECYTAVVSGSKIFPRPALAMSMTVNDTTPPITSPNQEPLGMMNNQVKEHLESLALDHPYRHTIENELDDPTSIIVAHCLSLIEKDKRRGSGTCEYCFSDHNLSPAQQTKNHSDKYSTHFWACEQKHNPHFWRNPITGQLVQHTIAVPEDLEIDAEDLKIEREEVWAALKENRDSSHAAMLAKIVLSPNDTQPEEQGEDDVSIEDDETGRTLSERYGRGCYRLSCATKIGPSRRPIRRFFCPICFFRSSTDHRKHRQKEGDDDVRFIVFLEAKRIAEHLFSDWAAVKQSDEVVGGINYNKTFKCGFPECKDLPIMKTGRMISHLHNVHEYNLVQCSLSHNHSPECYDLPEEDFRTITDARLMEEHLAVPLPTTNLVEFRRSHPRKTQEKKILRLKEKKATDSSIASSAEASLSSESFSVSSGSASSSSSSLFAPDFSF